MPLPLSLGYQVSRPDGRPLQRGNQCHFVGACSKGLPGCGLHAAFHGHEEDFEWFPIKVSHFRKTWASLSLVLSSQSQAGGPCELVLMN